MAAALFALLPALTTATGPAQAAVLCVDAAPSADEIMPLAFHLKQMLYWFLACAAADACLRRLLPESARWFALHAASPPRRRGGRRNELTEMRRMGGVDPLCMPDASIYPAGAWHSS